jgi:hypothetical protein
MAESKDSWSERRKITAQRVAAAVYGVVAIMTAELAVQPGEFGYLEAALGALLVGVAMTATRIFVEVVKKETEIGAHVPLRAAGAILRISLMVMLFPAATAVLILTAAVITARWTVLIDVVLYLGMVTIFAIGFLSSYILDGKFRPALFRGAGWLLLSLALLAAKSLA